MERSDGNPHENAKGKEVGDKSFPQLLSAGHTMDSYTGAFTSIFMCF